jgi:hypothetical protein
VSQPHRRAIIAFKLLSAILGLGILGLSLTYSYFEFGRFGGTGTLSPADIILGVAVLGMALSAISLVAGLPNSLRIRFRHIVRTRSSQKAYGFGTLFAVGIGATIGSPLFILIPLNIVQYEVISIGSLLIAGVLSLFMTKIYSKMYTALKDQDVTTVGGPSFTRVISGPKSVRYFVARLSMSLANTALAAYCAIVFAIFDLRVVPNLLASYGISGEYANLSIIAIFVLFVAWFLVNSLLERQVIRGIGRMQVVLSLLLVAILVYQSVLLGFRGSWDLAGLFAGSSISQSSFSWVYALILNTAYLYLLFFGFQEIQALEREAVESSPIPIVSWVKKGFTLPKSIYLGRAMIASVVSALVINILYALSVYSVHPSLSSLSSSDIPALYLSQHFLGTNQESLTAFAFLIATLTTFVPAFMAASRHLAALGEDGFLPQGVSNVSWLFVLVTIVLMAAAGQDFLVNITDFMVLISLGLIAFSGVWVRKLQQVSGGPNILMSAGVGVACFGASAAIYVLSPSVAVFGALAILVDYLLYDIFELGSFGIQLFLAIFDLLLYAALTLYPERVLPVSSFVLRPLNISISATDLFLVTLGACVVLLLFNLIIDNSIRRRGQVAPIERKRIRRSASRSRRGPAQAQAQSLGQQPGHDP